VLCCAEIDDPIIRRMIISTQGTFVLDRHELGFPFFSYHSFSSNNSSQSVLIFYNKNNVFHLSYEFC
jgi:hypothetical protein